MQIFVAPSGRSFALRNAFPNGDGDILVSADGRTYRELGNRGFAGSASEFDVTVVDPANDVAFRLHRSGDALSFNGETYRLTPGASLGIVVPLPVVRVPEYLFATPRGAMIYVSADRYKSSYESFKMFLGSVVPGDTLYECRIADVKRFLDGGTTWITTPRGTLFSPAPTLGGTSTWNGEPLTALDPAKFAITERGEIAMITRIA